MSRGEGRLGRSVSALRQVLKDPNLRRLELAFAGFNIAGWSTWIAILVYAYGVGGPTATGLVALIQLVPAAVVAPFAALLGDRHRRELVLQLGYLVQAVAVGATGAALLLEAPPALVYALAAAAAASLTVTRPAQGALLPLLARSPEQLTAANVASGTVEGVSILAGPALAGFLLAVSEPAVVFALMAGCLMVSALLASGIRTVARPAELAVSPHGFVGESMRGFRALASERRPRLLVGMLGAQNLVWGALDVLIVVVALELLWIGEAGVGYLTAALGVGGLAGTMATVALVGRPRLAPALGLGAVVWGLPIAVLGVVPAQAVAPVLLAAAGVGRGLIDVAGRTLLQRIVANDVLTRVFGVLEGMAMAMLGIGSIAAPAVISGLGVRGALIGFGLILPVVTIVLHRRLREVDSVTVVPTRQLALLRPLPLFAPLPVPALERLAASLIPMSVMPGAEVIRQGDVGDRFYVVAEGDMEVLVDGRSADVLGPGDHFGEIALLRDVARTATVRARTEAELYAMERDVFIAAVTGHPGAVEAADAVIARRLGARDVR